MTIFKRNRRQRMQRAGVEQVAGDWILRSDILPLEFGRQARSAPAGEGLGLEEAEVTNRGFGELFERPHADEREDAPSRARARIALPVKRRGPALRAHG